ncbi:MAG: FAD-dependent monooxygenase [Hyphomicrobiales bacterium]|nr:FAD-dependent monooxygenase [Hyphomicrobiales bacterium]MBV8663426.1 FAD-dependent monooxygenase [Hyphomicrobiales bacterium]
MAVSHSDPFEACDVFVVGAALTGLCAAIGLARAGFSVVSSGAADRLGRGRTVALLGRSVDFLKDLEVWGDIEPLAAPLRSLRIVDDAGGLFPARPVAFHADEIGLEAFGWNIENAVLADTFAAAASRQPNLRRIETQVVDFDFSGPQAKVRLADGRVFAPRLVVGADGRNSPARKAAGIEARTHRYPQSALTVFLEHTRPHEDYSTEFHTRGGPFTLVPLPPTAASRFRSSLVWVMPPDDAARRAALDEAALAREIERQARSMLGAMRIESEPGIFPMSRQVVSRLIAPRLALAGDAAHGFPPIGAQGLNLGLRDVKGVIEMAGAARSAGADIGGEAALKGYETARRPDILMRTMAVDGLNRSLIAHFAPIDAARAAGLAALAAVGPLRRIVMREGVAPFFG